MVAHNLGGRGGTMGSGSSSPAADGPPVRALVVAATAALAPRTPAPLSPTAPAPAPASQAGSLAAPTAVAHAGAPEAAPVPEDALRRAVEDGDAEAVETLLREHPALATARLVDPDISTLWTTPLHLAASYDAASIVALLLAAGARVRDEDSRGEGRTPLVEACQYAGVDVVRQLVAASDGGASIVSLPVGDKDKQWELPVHVAARAGDADVVVALLDAGAAPAAPDSGGETPLHKAGSYDRADVARTLISALRAAAWGRAINTQDADGETPLHDAASEGSEEVASLLCSAVLTPEVDVSLSDVRGDLVLHRLACLGPDDAWVRQCTVDVLGRSKGACLAVVNKAGMTPLVLAAQRRNLPFCEGVRDWLRAAELRALERPAQGPPGSRRPPEVLERNLCCGRGKDSETALHAAVRQGDIELVELLLDLGCSPATQNGARDHVLYVAPKGHPVADLIRAALERHEGDRKERGRLAWNDAFDKYQKSCSDALVAVLDSGMEEGYKMNIHARGPGGGPPS